MGAPAGRGLIVNKLCWWMVRKVTALLERNEREAVQGDLAELELSGAQALREAVGLFFRRQAAGWKDWRPWLAFFGIAGLVGPRLERIALSLGGLSVLQLQTWWKYDTYYKRGLSASEDLLCFGSFFLATIAWSLTSGCVFGSLSRRTIRTSGPLFLVIWLLIGPWRSLRFSDASNSLLAMGILVFDATLFLLPFWWGIRTASRTGGPRMRRALLWAAAVTLLTVMATWTSGWQQNALEAMSRGACCGIIGWQERILPIAIVSWPVAGLVALAASKQWREKNIAI